MNRNTILTAVAAAAAGLFAASAVQADPEYDACIENSRESEFQACGFAWLEREDRRLNAAWGDLLRHFEGQERAALIAEQRAWITFKDQSCNFFWSEYWGTVGRNNWYPQCRAAVIIARTAQLREISARVAEQ